MEENLDVTGKMEGIPIVTLRDLVVFPKTTVYFEVGRENTVKALKEAMNGRQLVFTVHRKTRLLKHQAWMIYLKQALLRK